MDDFLSSTRSPSLSIPFPSPPSPGTFIVISPKAPHPLPPSPLHMPNPHSTHNHLSPMEFASLSTLPLPLMDPGSASSSSTLPLPLPLPLEDPVSASSSFILPPSTVSINTQIPPVLSTNEVFPSLQTAKIKLIRNDDDDEVRDDDDDEVRNNKVRSRSSGSRHHSHRRGCSWVKHGCYHRDERISPYPRHHRRSHGHGRRRGRGRDDSPSKHGRRRKRTHTSQHRMVKVISKNNLLVYGWENPSDVLRLNPEAYLSHLIITSAPTMFTQRSLPAVDQHGENLMIHSLEITGGILNLNPELQRILHYRTGAEASEAKYEIIERLGISYHVIEHRTQ